MSILNRIPIINSLINDQGFLRYFKNTSWLLSLKALRGVNTLIIGVILARYLGPNDYGILSYSLAYIFVFSALAKMGLDSIVVRNLVKQTAKTETIMGTSFVLRLVSAILSISILLVVSSFIHNGIEEKMISILSVIIFFFSFSVFDFYFQSKVMMRLSAYSNFIAVFLSILIKLCLVFYKAPLFYFAFAFVVEYFLLSICYLVFYNRVGSSIRNWSFNKDVAKNLIQDSLPLLVSAVFIVIYIKIDQIMIKSLLDSVEVGKYAAAALLSEGSYFLPMVIATSLFPAIINAKEHSKQRYIQRLGNLYRLMFYLAIIISIGISISSNWIIEIFYGPEYSASADILKIHVWASIFVFLGVANSRWLIAENLQIYGTIVTAIGALVNILLNYIFIPKYGIVGSAWATVISYFLSGYFLYSLFSKTRSNFILLNASIFKIPLIFSDENKN